MGKFLANFFFLDRVIYRYPALPKSPCLSDLPDHFFQWGCIHTCLFPAIFQNQNILKMNLPFPTTESEKLPTENISRKWEYVLWAPITIESTSSSPSSIRITYPQLPIWFRIQPKGMALSHRQRERNLELLNSQSLKVQLNAGNSQITSTAPGCPPKCNSNKTQWGKHRWDKLTSCLLPPGVCFSCVCLIQGRLLFPLRWLNFRFKRRTLKIRTYLIYLTILGGKSNSCG